MMLPNTLSYEIAGEFLSDARNGIAIVGWADPETPGGTLREKHAERIKQIFNIEKLLCDIKVFYFSAHSHREELLQMIERLKPRKTLLCHGDEAALHWMKENIIRRAISRDVIIPEMGKILSL